MTATAVEWVLDQLASVVDAQPTDHPLRRVDRDNALLYEGSDPIDMSTPIEERTGELKQANYVGASLASPTQTPVGTEYDLELVEVVGIRLEGYSGGFGHIDPAGTDGVVFEDLKQEIRSAIYDGREFPNAGRTDVTFHSLTIQNAVPASADWAEYHRWDADILFDGFEELG